MEDNETQKILSSLFWGRIEFLDFSNKKLFLLTGLSHILVASGSNVELIRKLINTLTFFLNVKIKKVVVIVIVTIYSLTVGFNNFPILRAYISFIIIYITKMLGYKTNPIYPLIIFIGLTYLIVESPFSNLSISLSVLATLSLILLSNYVEVIIKKYWTLGYKSISQFISVNLLLIPYIGYFTGQIALIALPANYLILPIVEIIMNIMFVKVIIEKLLLFININYLQLFENSISVILNYLVTILMRIIDYLASLEFSYLRIEKSNDIFILIPLLLLLILLIKEFMVHFKLRGYNINMFL